MSKLKPSTWLDLLPDVEGMYEAVRDHFTLDESKVEVLAWIDQVIRTLCRDRVDVPTDIETRRQKAIVAARLTPLDLYWDPVNQWRREERLVDVHKPWFDLMTRMHLAKLPRHIRKDVPRHKRLETRQLALHYIAMAIALKASLRTSFDAGRPTHEQAAFITNSSVVVHATGEKLRHKEPHRGTGDSDNPEEMADVCTGTDLAYAIEPRLALGKVSAKPLLPYSPEQNAHAFETTRDSWLNRQTLLERVLTPSGAPGEELTPDEALELLRIVLVHPRVTMGNDVVHLWLELSPTSVDYAWATLRNWLTDHSPVVGPILAEETSPILRAAQKPTLTGERVLVMLGARWARFDGYVKAARELGGAAGWKTAANVRQDNSKFRLLSRAFAWVVAHSDAELPPWWLIDLDHRIIATHDAEEEQAIVIPVERLDRLPPLAGRCSLVEMFPLRAGHAASSKDAGPDDSPEPPATSEPSTKDATLWIDAAVRGHWQPIRRGRSDDLLVPLEIRPFGDPDGAFDPATLSLILPSRLAAP